MTGGQGPAASPHPQRGISAGDSAGTPHRHPNGANGARPKHGALACRELGLLASADTAGDPASAETQVTGDGHETTETGDQTQRYTETGDGTGQCMLLACNMTEDTDEERKPPERQRTLNEINHQGGEEGGGPLTQ